MEDGEDRPAAPAAPDVLVELLARLTTAQTAAPRIRTINCKSYKIGEDWSVFESYFRENVKAAYQYPAADARLDDACCAWIGSKLEPGPTLTAYQNLDDATRNDWDDLRMKLAELYCNEEEKQLFLAHPGGYKKGNKSLMEYKNELVRLVDLYQPDLKNVGVEYQRQLVTRFIEGIEDTTLQRKLRFYCKRKQTIEDAYEYAVDYESTETETRAKEIAATSRSVLGATGTSASSATSASAGASSYKHTGAEASPASLRILERSVDPKVKALELGLEQVKAGLAKTNDDMATMQKTVTSGFEELKSMMTAQHNRPAQYNNYSRPGQAANQQQYQHRGRGRGFRGQPVSPGLTGGPGYVNNTNGRSWAPANPRRNQLDLPATTASAMATGDQAEAAMPMPSAPPTPQHGPTVAGMQGTSHFMPQHHTPQYPHMQHGPEPIHPMADAGQNAYPFENMWAPHLEIEDEWSHEPPYTGAYSFYPPGFQ